MVCMEPMSSIRCKCFTIQIETCTLFWPAMGESGKQEWVRGVHLIMLMTRLLTFQRSSSRRLEMIGHQLHQDAEEVQPRASTSLKGQTLRLLSSFWLWELQRKYLAIQTSEKLRRGDLQRYDVSEGDPKLLDRYGKHAYLVAEERNFAESQRHTSPDQRNPLGNI